MWRSDKHEDLSVVVDTIHECGVEDENHQQEVVGAKATHLKYAKCILAYRYI